jgi:molybdate transport system substrate-binding protein
MSPLRDTIAMSCALIAAVQLTVFAASSLGDAFQELGDRFAQEQRGAAGIAFNFAGSQELRTQIEHGARADVAAFADEAQLRSLADAGLAAPPSIFARNSLSLVVPRGNPAGIRTLRDLPRARRIVVGDASVPVGAYTVRVLDAAAARYGSGFLEAVQARIASRELNVRQVLAKVSLGEADAAFVYRTDAAHARASVEAIDLPPGLNVEAAYPVATLRDAPHPELAAAFVRLVLSPEGRAILARHGFQ